MNTAPAPARTIQTLGALICVDMVSSAPVLIGCLCSIVWQPYLLYEATLPTARHQYRDDLRIPPSFAYGALGPIFATARSEDRAYASGTEIQCTGFRTGNQSCEVRRATTRVLRYRRDQIVTRC